MFRSHTIAKAFKQYKQDKDGACILTVNEDRVSPPIPAAQRVIKASFGLWVQYDDVVQLSHLVVTSVSCVFIANFISVQNI